MALNPPSPYDLCTVQDVMNFLNPNQQTYSDAEKNEFQFWVTDISRYMLKRTGRDTLNSVQVFNEVLNGSGSMKQCVRNRIIKINSVTIVGVSVPPSSNGVNFGYQIGTDNESVDLVGTIGPAAFLRTTGTFGMNPGGLWPRGAVFVQGLGNVVINYLGGFDVQEHEPWTIPSSGAMTVTVYGAASFVLDLGVIFSATGVALTPSSMPGEGQYSVANGVYTFNAADAGLGISIAYAYNGVPEDMRSSVIKVVAQTYKRQRTIDMASNTLSQAGTTRYRDWSVEPIVAELIEAYKRQGLNVT